MWQVQTRILIYVQKKKKAHAVTEKPHNKGHAEERMQHQSLKEKH